MPLQPHSLALSLPSASVDLFLLSGIHLSIPILQFLTWLFLFQSFNFNLNIYSSTCPYSIFTSTICYVSNTWHFFSVLSLYSKLVLPAFPQLTMNFVKIGAKSGPFNIISYLPKIAPDSCIQPTLSNFQYLLVNQ